MQSEADSRHPLETGGILIGLNLPNGASVVSHVVGPGPNAVHHRDGFVPDHDFQDEELARIYVETGRKVHYLGDWHTHPDAPPFLSGIDRKTLGFIAASDSVRVPHVFMLIWGSKSGQWQGRAWRAATGRRRRWWQALAANLIISAHDVGDLGITGVGQV